MAAEREIFLREYIATRASDKELRALTLDLLDGIEDLKEDINSTGLGQSLESWAAKTELELYKAKIRQVEMAHHASADNHAVTMPPTPSDRQTSKTSADTIWLILGMVIVLVLASMWSLAVGCVVLVAYIIALLMSLADGIKLVV